MLASDEATHPDSPQMVAEIEAADCTISLSCDALGNDGTHDHTGIEAGITAVGFTLLSKTLRQPWVIRLGQRRLVQRRGN